jgi:methionyl-tRNA formyltransferase
MYFKNLTRLTQERDEVSGKIIIFTSNSLYSSILLKDLIQKDNERISSIYISKSLKKQKFNRFLMKKVIGGLGIRYYAQRVIYDIKYKYSNDSIVKLANKYNIPVFFSSNVNDEPIANKIKLEAPDLIISAYFDQIIKKELLEIPHIGILNVHPSMLPAYRGVKPTFWVLKNNMSKTGITIHFVDEGIDTGKILVQKKIDILPYDSVDSLLKRTSEIGAKVLLEAIESIKVGNYNLEDQRSKPSSYFSQPTKQDIIQFRKLGKRFY